MWKMSKRLAACMFAAAWWSIFYPELCFSEDTCSVVQTEYAQEDAEEARRAEEIDAAAVWRSSGDRIIIRSRLWEWCEEKLFDKPENAVQSAPVGR